MKEYSLGGKWLDDLNHDLEGSDRSCAVLAGAILDQLLNDLLSKYLLPPDKKDNDKLLGSSSPLDTFSSRIELARRLNLISLETRKALDWVRYIRNIAAHETDFSFDDNSNSDRVENVVSILKLRENVPDLLTKPYDNTKGHFVASITMLHACLAIETGEISQTNFQPVNAIGNIHQQKD